MCYDDASTVVLTDGGLFLRGSNSCANAEVMPLHSYTSRSPTATVPKDHLKEWYMDEALRY